MDISDTPRPIRHDGWTPARTIGFLHDLSACGNVRAACSAVGLSPEAAYKRRRRDALFARAWAAALVLGREASAEVLECRAIDGVEEAVWYRGEVVGHRRRYDTRLLLAHMARLDAQAETGQARDDAARFDELLACVGGVAVPEGLATDGDGLPLSRAACIEAAGEAASEEFRAEAEAEDEAEDEDEDGEESEHHTERFDALIERAVTCFREGLVEGAARWDAWTGTAYAAVDGWIAQSADDPFDTAGTLSTASTSGDLAGTAACSR